MWRINLLELSIDDRSVLGAASDAGKATVLTPSSFILGGPGVTQIPEGVID